MTTTRVLVAPDKFKGSLTGIEAARLISQGVHRADSHAEVSAHPVADGGEGTLQAVVRAGYRWIPARASGPLGGPVETGFAERGGHAVVELADACGLAKLPNAQPDPLRATSHGVGEMIPAAREHGCTSMTLAVGGSASTDGGAGMLQALGVHLLDEDGAELPPGGGAALARQHHVPALALTGRCDLNTAQLREMGFENAWQLRALEPDLDSCLRHAHALLPKLATTAYTWWRSR